ncbi:MULTISPECIES: hypothetical protein [unclassified Streptomyces]|uniref:hypothetical protein n=1 Tax=unclassified Streptomyces TaxID=2593676 RepID=UPI0033FD89E1
MQSIPGPAHAVVLRHPHSRAGAPLSPSGAELLRIISDPSMLVFLTVHAGGRRRYSYWQPFEPRTGRGSCYVALPTDLCDMLHSSGRITLGEPLVDSTRTTYRVGPAETPVAPRRSLRTGALAA